MRNPNVLQSLLVLAALFLLVIGLSCMTTGCNIPASTQEQLAAQGIYLACELTTAELLKDKPAVKAKLVVACDEINQILATGLIPKYKHISVFIGKFKIVSNEGQWLNDVVNILVKQLNYSLKPGNQMLSQRDYLFLLSFVGGIRAGASK